MLANLFKSTRLQASFPANLVPLIVSETRMAWKTPMSKAPVRLTLSALGVDAVSVRLCAETGVV